MIQSRKETIKPVLMFLNMYSCTIFSIPHYDLPQTQTYYKMTQILGGVDTVSMYVAVRCRILKGLRALTWPNLT